MTWIRRILLASPFVVAAVLTVLSRFADRVHLNLQRIAGYCFLFGAPCGWLLGRDGFGGAHGRWMQLLIDGAVMLWIPALLYSGCLWLLLRLLGLGARRVPR